MEEASLFTGSSAACDTVMFSVLRHCVGCTDGINVMS